VEPARRLARVEPVYPALLRRQRIEADVTVRVSLDASGRVLEVELVRSAAQQEFDQAALEAARKERFAPETHDGRSVATSLTYTYRFRVES
jgi:protein TonB